MSLLKDHTYRTYLERELQLRTGRNPKYSLRAFARDLGVAPPKLSQILKGTCGLSGEAAQRIADRMKMSPMEADYFITLVNAEHSRSKAGKRQAGSRLQELRETKFDELDLERFQIIADWYHFAILELSEVTGFRSDARWIARRLGITLAQSAHAIERLLDHGLLVRDRLGNLRQTQAQLATPSGIPSRELRAHHSQILKKADLALENVPVDGRDFSASTFSIDSSQLDEAKKALREFRRKFCKNLQEKSPKDRVFCLAIQMFPLDQVTQERGEIA